MTSKRVLTGISMLSILATLAACGGGGWRYARTRTRTWSRSKHRHSAHRQVDRAGRGADGTSEQRG